MSADFLTKKEDVSTGRSPARPGLNALERAMIVVLAVTLAAACFMLSSRHRPEGEDGSNPWRAGSLLQPLTQLMSLNFEYPTVRGTEVKWLIQGLGAAAALLAAVVGWYVWTKPRDPEDRPADLRPRRVLRDRLRIFFSSAAPASAAQIALVLFAGWTFLSAWWAPWPAGALGEACRQLIPIVWAVVLGRTLTARGARTAAMFLVGILALTAVIGIWYFYERNPGQRLKFPIGNPIFLAACLLPVLLLPAAWAAGWLEGLIRSSARRTRAPSGNGPVGDERAASVPLWVVLVFLACCSLAAWAFKLSSSRGPAIGLACGLGAIVYVVAPRWSRWTLVILAVVVLAAGGLWVRSHWNDEGSRWATTRFRAYTWKYALDRFLVRPVTGTGQGGYLLGAQAMCLEDVEKDPAAFPGGMIEHAHNEWLEILSDLGAAGLALIATALGITFWAAGLAVKKLPERLDRWLLLGLVGTLAAMIVEEATDVALRMPVFPLLFCSVVGLIWALSASTDAPAAAPTEPSHSAGVRVCGLLLGIVGATAIAWLSVADWQGARAEFRIDERVEKKDWPEALVQAAAAQRMRLGIEDRLMSASRSCWAAQEAAGFWFDQLRAAAITARQSGSLPPAGPQIAAENAARFDGYCEASVTAGNVVLQRMPYFPHVAGQLAGLMLMKGQQEQIAGAMMAGRMEQIEQALRAPAVADRYVAEARRLRELEYRRDPFNPELALRLLGITPPSEPLAGRLNLLRVPMRAGPVHPGVAAVLAELAQEDDFSAVMNEWMTQAQAALRSPAPPWADSYAPETLRLAALAYEVRRGLLQHPAADLSPAERVNQTLGLARQSAKLAENAATLLLAVRARFPTAAALARADQARYRLWAAPLAPAEALAVARQALAEWPDYGPRDQRRSLQEGLSMFLLAVGDEDQARENLRALDPTLPPVALEARLAGYLRELDNWFINVPPQARPARFDDWVARLVKLDPDEGFAHLMAAQVALEHANDAGALDHLERLQKTSEQAQFTEAVNFLLRRFPENEALRVWAKRLFRPRPVGEPMTQPVGEPESQPAGETASRPPGASDGQPIRVPRRPL